MVRSQLEAWGLTAELPALELAVSELVTNAIVHGCGQVEVRIAEFDPATGVLDPESVARLLDQRVRLVATCVASNAIGQWSTSMRWHGWRMKVASNVDG